MTREPRTSNGILCRLPERCVTVPRTSVGAQVTLVLRPSSTSAGLNSLLQPLFVLQHPNDGRSCLVASPIQSQESGCCCQNSRDWSWDVPPTSNSAALPRNEDVGMREEDQTLVKTGHR